MAIVNGYEFVDLTGTILPDTALTRFEVEREYKAVFGEDFIVTANTPQGGLITADVITRDTVVRNNAQLANQINPNLAGGVYLDAICKLTNLDRGANESSIITGVILAGRPRTNLPAETSTAKTAAGDIFYLLSTVSLDSEGNGVGDFAAQIPGPISVSAGQLNEIDNGPLGWETVTNPNASSIGTVQQSDVSLRQTRKDSLALQGMGLLEAIKSALTVLPGVRSSQGMENPTDVTVVKNEVTLLPHSIWFCVDGGTDNSVANTLLAKKSGGCNYNGALTVNVLDPVYGVVTYPVSFDRPTLKPVLIRYTIKAGSSVADPVETCRAATLSYADGKLNGEPGFVVGASVSPFELAGAVTCQAPSIYVKLVEVSFADVVSWQSVELPIKIFEKATVVAGSITVIVDS